MIQLRAASSEVVFSQVAKKALYLKKVFWNTSLQEGGEKKLNLRCND